MNPQLQAMLQQAIQAFQDGNFNSADLILKRVLQVDSKNLPALHVLGLIKASQSNYREAADYLSRAARIHPNDASIQYNLAKALSDSGNDKDALAHHKKAVALAPNNPEAWLGYGNTASNLGRYDDALVWYSNALSLRPDYAEAALNKGATLKELKRYEEAIVFADQALVINPNLAEAWSNKGVALNELKRYDEALAHYDKALSLKPDYHKAWANKGVTLHELKRYDEAIAHYDQALSINSEYAEGWSNKGVTLNELKRYEEAITHYDKALSLKSDYVVAYSNKGNVLHELKRYEEAIAQFDNALSLKPDYAEVWSNKGNSFYKLKRYEEAIAHYDRTLSLKFDYAEGWSNKGYVLHELARYDEAIAHFDKALSLKPDIDWINGDLLFTKMKSGSWSDLSGSLEEISKRVLLGEKVIQPFLLLSLLDDASLHKQASEIFARNKYPENPILGPITKHPKKEKIRIGYFSADFKNHAVSILTAELFELHDKDRFEIIAFSFGVDDKSPIRARLSQAFSQFIDVRGMSDLDIAKLSRELRVDIAVDLSGYTSDNRTGIFSYRAAPIQVNWLGYPGTIGANFIDYIVADKTIIPAQSEQFYTEKVVSLPDTYIVDDSKRLASSRVFTRAELGLPENVFVFCCFNNDYKFNPQVLDAWARILLQAKNSVVWISENNQSFKGNIVAEFNQRGIDSSRVIFAQRQDLMADHLARYALADLFLDTCPYNAHTTALDSLKAGIPVLTLMGQSFASRVAASLLRAAGLPELIANTWEEYEALAIELAMSPQKLAQMKSRLADNRMTAPLFNTPLFTKNLETAYSKMYERYQADLPVDHISIC